MCYNKKEIKIDASFGEKELIMKEKFYLTTAIAYASRKPHIGNTYEIVFADAVARFKRMQGYDVHFVTGTDEHGQKVEDLAKESGISPKQYVDSVAGEIKTIWDLMDSTYDTFIRTTDDYHERVVQKIFKKLYDQGDIYKSEYQGLYCVPCESFFTETQLVDGKCPDCGREVVPTKEEAYFFKMSKYQDRLMEYIEQHPDFIQPKSRENEMVNNFLKPGLQDLCVSRTSFTWGVQVDFDPKHVVYVWLDALVNYITAIGYDPEGSSELFEKEWPADLHIIGKDILRFHTIYWPIFLMALDLPLPKQIFGHPWLLSGQDKMSKSVGNVIYADDLVRQFGSVDAVRFYLLSAMPYAQDGSITYENVISRFNSELANTLGNLVNRTVTMVGKYFDGVIPAPTAKAPLDEELSSMAKETVAKFDGQMNALKTSDAIDTVMAFARRCNKYIDETMPWALAKDEAQTERLGTVLYNLLEGIRFIAVLLTPFMPTTAAEILTQINAPDSDYASLKEFGGIRAGDKVGQPRVLFGRIDEAKKLAEIQAEIESKLPKKEEKKAEKQQGAPAGIIAIDDFAKVSLRVAQIKECEKVAKSDKLLRLILDDGEGSRQVVSGIAKWYSPEELVGKKVIIVANLKPVKLRGVESQGMILAADVEDGAAKVLFVDDSVPAGAKIR